MRPVVLAGSSLSVAGESPASPEELAAVLASTPTEVPEPVPVEPLSTDRLHRGDRLTRLCARTAAAALPGGFGGDRASVLTASVLATSHTNRRFEQRRQAGLPVEPRSFPFTAPNAAAGELTIALRARGPTLALVGDGAVGLAALQRAIAWIAAGRCDAALVVVVECPAADGDQALGVMAVECAAAIVLEAASENDPRPRLTATFGPPDPNWKPDALLSVGPVASLLCGSGLVSAGGPGAAAIYVAINAPDPRTQSSPPGP